MTYILNIHIQDFLSSVKNLDLKNDEWEGLLNIVSENLAETVICHQKASQLDEKEH